ncbi:beta-galactosidase [Aquabacterium parvum]|uniref:beta-galactosidase n=1 Tax=Aquabacterium parvum TaxID=70584 RepID=UPI000718D652|nr:beta-galactosidase [Aquabacterium parvum]
MSDGGAGLDRRALLQAGGALATLTASAAGWAAWPWQKLPEQVLKPARTVVWQDFLGLNAQLQWFPPEVAAHQVQRMKELGLNWVRLGLHWMLLEPKEGQFDLAPIDRMMKLVEGSGLKSIVYMVGTPRFASSVETGNQYERYFDKFPPRDPRLYAQRLMQVAKRYPQVNVWQVWNEPNILGFWAPKPDPEGYGRMLLASVQGLRATVPGKPIAMAGMAYFSEMGDGSGLMIEKLGRLGAFNLDVTVAYHPYTTKAEGSDADARDFVKRVVPAHQWLRSAGVKQIWATEWGWSSYKGPVEEQPIVGEDGQADFTLKRLALMAALDYDKVFLFTLSDLDSRASERDQHYGLLRLNGEPKPVFHALKRFLQVCGPRLEPDTPPAVEAVKGDAPEGLVSIGWRRPDGSRLWMAWAEKKAEVRIAAQGKGAVLHHPVSGRQTPIEPNQGKLRLTLEPGLQILVQAAATTSGKP